MQVSYFNDDPKNIRNQPEIGGGGLYDIGCYAVVAGRFFLGSSPRRAVAPIDRDPALRTDRTTCGLVDFGEGRFLDFTVSTQCVAYQRVQLCGTSGRIEILIPFNAPTAPPASWWTTGWRSTAAASRSRPSRPAISTRSRPRRSRAPSWARRRSPYGVEDAVENMRVIDALHRSERSGRIEDI